MTFPSLSVISIQKMEVNDSTTQEGKVASPKSGWEGENQHNAKGKKQTTSSPYCAQRYFFILFTLICILFNLL